MNNKLIARLSTILMIATLLGQSLLPAVTVFAEDFSTGNSGVEQVLNEPLEDLEETETTSESSTESEESSTVPSSTSEESESIDASKELGSSESEPATNSEISATSTSDSDDYKKKAAREPQDISSLLAPGELFFTEDIQIKLNGTLIDLKENMEPIELKKGDFFEIGYNWNLPERLDGQLMAGDWYEIDLPSGLPVIEGNGDLSNNGEVYGQYSFKEGKLKVTFNEKVEEGSVTGGQVWYSQELEDNLEAGLGEIIIPVTDNEVKIPIFVQPSGGSAIQKSIADKPQSAGEIDWVVSINTNLKKLMNAKVVENLDEKLTFSSVEIYKQKIDGKGNVVGVIEPKLVENTDYQVDQQGNVTFIGQYQTTRESFQLRYKTTIVDEKISAEGGKIDFPNTAILQADNQENQSSTTSTSRQYGKFLEKSAVESTTAPREFDWTIKFNFGEKVLEKGTYLEDQLDGDAASIVADSITLTDESGKPLVGINPIIEQKLPKGFKITFPDGVDRQKILVKYRTKYDAIIPDKENPIIQNKVTTNVPSGKENANEDEKFLGTVGSVGIGEQGLSKSYGINYNTHKIDWTVDINKGQYEMLDWELTDTYSSHQVLNQDFVIKEFTSQKILVKDTDYSLSIDETQNTFSVKFIGDLATKGTDKRYTMTYSTTFDPRKEQGQIKNTVAHTWKDKQQQVHQRESSVLVPEKSQYQDNITKAGSYNAQTKTIKWTITVNYMQDQLTNAYITDTLTNNPMQSYVPGSAKLYEMKIREDGDWEQPKDTVAPSSLEEPENQKGELKVGLPDGPKAYRLIFETKLDDQVLEKNDKVQNEAALHHNGEFVTASSEVTIAHGGNHLEKKLNTDEVNIAKWELTVNKAQSTLEDVVITDKPSANQVIDLSSLKVFKTTFNGNNVLQKTNETLTLNEDYTVDLSVNNDTGEQTLILAFERITQAYVIEYRSTVLPTQSGTKEPVSNKVAIEASTKEFSREETGESGNVNVSGGVAQTAAGKLILKKIDGTNEVALENVTFELWTVTSDKKKNVKIREGATNSKGELSFGGLRTSTDYLLVEKSTVDGYVISPEFKEGQLLQIPADPEDKNKPVDFSYEIKNETFAVSFNKVSKEEKGLKSKALSGAVFILQNASGAYYQGDQKGLVTDSNWVAEKTEATEFTSDSEGLVQVKGLLPGTYTFTEIQAPTGYELPNPITPIPFEITKNTENQQEVTEIKNVENTRQKTTFEVSKEWSDFENQYQTRPENIKVQLWQVAKSETGEYDLANGKQLEEVTLQENSWQHEFTNLLKYDEQGQEYQYFVTETPVHGYETTITAGKIKNTLLTTEVPVEKIWSDETDESVRPKGISVSLYQYIDGEVRPEKAFKTANLTAENDWKMIFSELPTVNKNGVPYIYDLVEHEVKGYSGEVHNVSKVVGSYHYRIINNLKSIDIPVEKVWEDKTDISIRPTQVQIDLYRTSDLTQEPVRVDNKTVTLSSSNGWSDTFTGLAKEDASGNDFIYTVKEHLVTGYKNNPEISGNQKDGYTITNHLELTEVKVEKNWEDFSNKYGLRPTEIHLTLMKQVDKELVPVERETVSDTGEIQKKPVELRIQGSLSENKWLGTFKGLTKYDSEGNLITYVVQEAQVTGYDAPVISTINNQQQVTITNTLATTNVPMTKEWLDEDNRFNLRPESITVSLYQNGKEFKEIEPVVVKADTKGNWQYTFENLPKYDAKGEAYVYTLFEASVPGYEGKINQETGEITNRLETIEIPVEKNWEDTFKGEADYYKSRPKSITVHLKQNGVEITQVPSVTMKANDTGIWSHTFTALPKYDTTGKEYVYTVTEDEVDKYNQAIHGSAEDGFTITNTRKTYAIGDYTWIDTNKDGIQDADEKALAGVLVELYDEKGNKIAETTTDENGLYLFDELADGKYQVKFTLTEDQSKKYEFTKQSADDDPQEDSDADPVTGWTKEITLDDENKYLTKDYSDQEFKASEGIDPTWDAGVILREKIAITGKKVWVGGPEVKPTIALQLYRNGEALGEPVTLEHGTTEYTWTDLYKTDTAKEAYVYTVKEVGTPSEYNKVEDGLTVTNTRKTYAIGDYTWIDTNKDGIQDADEKVLSGVIVELYDASGKKIAETKTDSQGRYLFDELEAGEYQVRFTLTPEQAKIYQFTKQHSGGNAGKDSNADPLTGWTKTIHLNEKNVSLTKDYSDQNFKASEGVDPTWDAGVILKDKPVEPNVPEEPKEPGKPTDSKKPTNTIPQFGEEITVAFGLIGFMMIGSAVGTWTFRRRKLKK